MPELRFTDGVRFNTDGPYRIERRHDGYYVVGHGMLMPVATYEEGQEIIRESKGNSNHEQHGT